MSTFTGYALETLIKRTMRKMFLRVTESGGVVTGDFSRYSRDDIIDAINEAVTEMALKAKLLRSFAFITLKAGRAQYVMPEDCWSITEAYYFPSGGSIRQLEIKPWQHLIQEQAFPLNSEGTPEKVCLGDSYSGGLRKLLVYPTPDSDGTAISFASEYGVVTSTNLPGFSGNLTGTHSGSSNNAQLVDATADFVDVGVTVGMMVFNTTDGSKAQITAVEPTIITATLAGGTDNDWDYGDSYQIPAGEYGEIVNIDSSETYIFSDEIGGIQAIFAGAESTKNMLIQFYRYPTLLTDSANYPEIYYRFHESIPHGAAYRLLEEERSNARMVEQAALCYQRFISLIEEARTYEAKEHMPTAYLMRPVYR